MNKADSVFEAHRPRLQWQLSNGHDAESCLPVLSAAFRQRLHGDPAPAIVQRWEKLLAGLPRRCNGNGCG